MASDSLSLMTGLLTTPWWSPLEVCKQDQNVNMFAFYTGNETLPHIEEKALLQSYSFFQKSSFTLCTGQTFQVDNTEEVKVVWNSAPLPILKITFHDVWSHFCRSMFFFLKKQPIPVAPVNIQPVYSGCVSSSGKAADPEGTRLVENDGNSNSVDT